MKKVSNKVVQTKPMVGMLGSHYKTLRTLAARVLAQHQLMQRAAGPDRVSPFSLVAEATLRLLLQRNQLKNSEQLQGLAVLSMKRALIDRARARGAKFRTRPADTKATAAQSTDPQNDLVQVLEALRVVQPRQADVIALVAIQGLSVAEAATRLGVSKPTVERDLRAARVWLRKRVKGS